MRRSSFGLPAAVFGADVFAKTLKDGVTQSVFLGPAAELHARDEFRCGPKGSLIGLGHAVEGRFGGFEFFQLRCDLFVEMRIETAAGMADKAQGLFVIKPEENRAEGDAGVACGGPATNDGIECLGNLDFGPTGAAIGDVAAVDPLGHDAFEPLLLGELEKLLAVFDLVIREAEAVVGVEESLQKLLALQHRNLAEIESVDVEKVEEEIDGGNLGDEGRRRGANVHALLQQTKVAMAAGVQRDDFAVENSLMRCQSLRKPGEFWVTIGDFDSVA